jgi:2-polyprenyl-3-methyl-5-hydroxy-6-metoxy-1,4-benzoquinol methylase
MNYSLQQRGRASVDFLIDLGVQAHRLEMQADEYADSIGLRESVLPDDLDELQARVTPAMQECAAFRVFHLVREWQLDAHGVIATEAFDEVRPNLEPALKQYQVGPTQIAYDSEKKPPAYWDGYEFHRSAGGWDGHDHMGFIHGEIIHRKMVDDTLGGLPMAQRKAAAQMIPLESPAKILEMGCGSGQYTEGLAEVFPDAEIWGCDLSPRQLEQAQRWANEHGKTWKLFEAAAEETGLEGAQFDLVTSYALLHELPNTAIRQLLAETLRLLKPGGITFVGEIKAYKAMDKYTRWKSDFLNQLRGGDPFWREFCTTDLAAVATEVGFVDAEWAGVGENQYPFVLTAKKSG